MKPNFAACYRRLDGATEDFKTLGKELGVLSRTYGTPIETRTEPQPQRGRFVILVNWVMPLPPHWDRRIAHILYDARSALDHLVHELYVATNGKRPPTRIARKLQFPICTSARSWKTELGQHRLDGIDARLVELVRRHQPFLNRYPARQVFARLQRLNDLDKHRRANVVLMAARDFHLEVQVKGIGIPRVVPIGFKRALKGGTELAYVYVTPWGLGDQHVQVKGQGSFSPGLGHGVLVDDLLTKVLTETRAVLSECEAEWLARTQGLPLLDSVGRLP